MPRRDFVEKHRSARFPLTHCDRQCGNGPLRRRIRHIITQGRRPVAHRRAPRAETTLILVDDSSPAAEGIE